MIKSPLLSLILSTAFGVMASAALAQDKPGPQGKPAAQDKTEARTPFQNYTDKSRGWHFKEIIPIEEEPQPPPPTTLPPPTTPPAPPEQAASSPKPLSPAWIRESLPKYLDAAIEQPTPQNVSNYLYLQRYAIDASDRFSQVYKRESMSDPILDENNTRAIWAPGARQLEATALREKDKSLKSLSKRAGLWFFFRSDCEPCHIEAPILSMFAKKHGFSVMPISIDGAPLRNSPFEKYKVDAGQANILGVQYTPAIYLVGEGSTVVPISQGMVTIEELETRVTELATAAGLIKEDEYRRTRGDNKNFLVAPADTGIAAPTEPNEVRDYLKSLIQRKN